MTKLQRKLWGGLLVMALLTPLGLLLPAKFEAGTAWGEWGQDSLGKLIGYVPEGLQRLSSLWKAPLADYRFGSPPPSLTWRFLSYMASGLLGILAVGLAMYLILELIKKNGK